jgi:hypothetical protein
MAGFDTFSPRCPDLQGTTQAGMPDLPTQRGYPIMSPAAAQGGGQAPWQSAM